MRRFLFLLGCFAFILGPATAQNRTLTGMVTDANGGSIAGATVAIKGTNRGTSTAGDGSFTVTVPASARTLIVSAVNFITREVDISGRTDAGTIALKPGTQTLNEVVVVAYGTQKKTNVTGSVATVSGTLLADKPFTSVDKELQGNVAGLLATSASGAPGSSTDIRIRGIGSILASASPLWVIDGAVIQTGDLTVNTTTANPLSTLDPDDIESISVLKDPVATAPYGSRGANGVILVTTKKGKIGKSRINVIAELGQNSRAFNPANKPLTGQQLTTVMRETLINSQYATDNAGADAIITSPNGFGFPANYSKMNTNWFDVSTQNGNQSQVNLNLSGGSDKTTIYASAGYFNQKGVSIASDFKRFSGALSVTHKASDRFTLSANINASNTAQHTPANGGAFANPVLASFFLLPWYTPYNPDGSMRYGNNDSLGEFGLNGGIFNPVAQAALNMDQAQQTSVRGNATGELRILDNLKFTSRFAGDYVAVQEDQYRNPFYGDGYANGGDASSNYTRVFSYTWSNFADWKQKIDPDGDIYFDLKAGLEAYDRKFYTLQASGKNFPQTLALKYMANTSTPTVAYATPDETAIFSEFAIADLNYKDRCVLSGSLRRDESSVFGAAHRWGTFYSVGGSWNINEEHFMKQQDLFNLLKLRAAFGQTGNSNGFSTSAALPLYGSSYTYNGAVYGGNYAGRPGLVPNNVGNAGLTWEKNQAFNLGLDFGVLKNRIGGTLEYYHRETTGLLSPVPFSLTSGFSSQLENIGSVVNKGFEITLNGRPVVTRNFTWQISFNIAHNINRVKSLLGNKPIPSGNFEFTIGHDLQEFYLQQWAGVNPQTGAPQWYTDGAKKTITGNYDSAGLALDHSAAPSVFGGLSNAFTYKNFSLDFQFNYNFGNYIFDSWYYYLNSDGQFLGALNQMNTQLNAWKKPGDKTDVPQLLIGGNNNANQPSTRWLYKGNFIRLRNIQVSYSLASDAVKRMHLGSLSIYFRGTNLWTFGTDKNLPFDPEAGVNSTANLEVLIPKTVAGGIRIGF